MHDFLWLVVQCSTSITLVFVFFFFNDTATTEIYTLSLHDALPISRALALAQSSSHSADRSRAGDPALGLLPVLPGQVLADQRSEEHTSELQSHSDLVCRLLLEKKKNPPLSLPGTRKSPVHLIVFYK